MALFGGKRTSSHHFEIMTQREGRWLLDSTVGTELDGLGREPTTREVQKAEENAVSRAKSLLATGDFQAVKVVCETTGVFGHKSNKEVFSQVSTVKRGERLVPQAYKGDVPLCATPDDLTRRPSCRVIGTVYRDLLNKYGLIAIELVHFYPHLRRLEEQSMLLQAGLRGIAERQAEGTDRPVKERMSQLQDLTAKAISRARDAMAERRLPPFADADLDGLLARLAQRFQGDDVRYFAVIVMARELMGAPSQLARLDLALRALPQAHEADAVGLLDEVVAGCLDMSGIVMELVGHQPSLAEAMAVLSELGNGAFWPARGGNAMGGQVASHIREGRLIWAKQSIWDRILREVGSGSPLIKAEPRREWAETQRMIDVLGAAAPEAYRERILRKLAARLERMRQRE
ncbi:MAG: hypothetical protein J0H82_22980 [Alphaproteobacteria bacterium]|jgi:hypothetical protein|nr:hypothetical protein [Alphaproteobacteria bacterium]